MTEPEAQCAHLRVSYRTENVTYDGPDVPSNDDVHVGLRRGQTLTRGWWECDSNCGMRFVPDTYAARLTVLEQENAELREDRDLLRVQVGHAISRLSECALPRQVEHAKFGVYSGSDAGEAFDELRKRARITFTDNGFTLDADARSA